MFIRGALADTVFLSIGRAILRKQERENRKITDAEALGHAQVLQGRYQFVNNEVGAEFCQKVVLAFRYVEQQNAFSISELAYLKFKTHEALNRSALDSVEDDELVNDLRAAGFSF